MAEKAWERQREQRDLRQGLPSPPAPFTPAPTHSLLSPAAFMALGEWTGRAASILETGSNLRSPSAMSPRWTLSLGVRTWASCPFSLNAIQNENST